MTLFIVQILIFLPFAFFNEQFNLFIKITDDFYKIFALYLGFILAIYIENKYVNFTVDGPFKKKIIRFIIAVVILLVLQFGLKLILPTSLIFSYIRYFLISFTTIGLYQS